MKPNPLLPLALTLILTACGGGGSGGTVSGLGGVGTGTYTAKCAAGSGSISQVSSSISQADADSRCPASTAALNGTGIAGLAGSSCAFTKYLPQARILDLDKAGYVAWWAGRVQCTLADGTVQNIAGLSKAAFSATGNGFTNTAMEDMVTGTSATDLAPTYTLQIYRKFATAAATTATAETLTVSGVDGNGRTVTARGVVEYGASYAMDDMFQNGASGTASATRTIDPDGKGYTATLFQVPYYYVGTSTGPSCPTSVSQPVKDFPSITVNKENLIIDRRHCLYTGLSTANFYTTKQFISASSNLGNWAWFFGADAGTPVSSFNVNQATIVNGSELALRMPVYKTQIAVRYPKAPNPNFAQVESSTGAYSTVIWLPALSNGISEQGPSGLVGTWNP